MKQPSIETIKWAENTWGKSQLGDQRRNKRAIKIATCLLENPSASIPTQMTDWKDVKGAYRFFASEEITHSIVQKEHWRNVIKLATESTKTILFIQDKSELDFHSKKQTKDLGPIGNHFNNGLFVQSVLAVEYDKKPTATFGLAYQKGWARLRKPSKKKVKVRFSPDQATEADHWIECLAGIEKPESVQNRFVALGDRENDTYKFVRYCKRSGWNFVVRAKSKREIISAEGKNLQLATFARSLPSQTTKTIELRARPGAPARDAILSIGWGKATMKAPKNYPNIDQQETIEISCIRVWEEGGDLEWFLITNLEVESKESALEIVGWYEARWIIEEYHKCLKTGCAMEDRQLQTAHGLLVLLGILGIIATKLLESKYLAKCNPSEKAINHYPILNVQVLAYRFDMLAEEMTCYQYWRTIARLGGFIGRKGDGEPGWQTLWKGWLKFQDMVEGAECWKKCG